MKSAQGREFKVYKEREGKKGKKKGKNGDHLGEENTTHNLGGGERRNQTLERIYSTLR